MIQCSKAIEHDWIKHQTGCGKGFEPYWICSYCKRWLVSVSDKLKEKLNG